MAVVCLSLMKLIYPLEQLLLLLMMLLQLRQMCCDVGQPDRCRSWSGDRGIGRIAKPVWEMVTNLGLWTRRWVARRRGRRCIADISHHQMNGLLIVRPYLPFATRQHPSDRFMFSEHAAYRFFAENILEGVGVACEKPTPVDQPLMVIRGPPCQRLPYLFLQLPNCRRSWELRKPQVPHTDRR